VKNQKLLIIETERPTVRDKAIGWTHEDSSLVKPGHIGMTGAPRPYYSPDCVLRAMSDGWKLLAPPVEERWLANGEGTTSTDPQEVERVSYTWYLVRDEEP
jgi:hypothetical protein